MILPIIQLSQPVHHTTDDDAYQGHYQHPKDVPEIMVEHAAYPSTAMAYNMYGNNKLIVSAAIDPLVR